MANLPYHPLPFCAICRKVPHECEALPGFPFTGIYCDENARVSDFLQRGVDQGLMLCLSCGHAQLKHVVNPRLVYDNTYTHRGSLSPIARQGNLFFSAFIERLCPGKKFKRILDVGCNDGYLLKQLEVKADFLLGIDPIWIGKSFSPTPKIRLVGGFVEEIDLKQELGGHPDLVVSAHAFEHIENPRKVLEGIIAQAAPEALFVIEVPSFDTLIKNYRFDQVFHQHIQYFSLASFSKLIEVLGCSYVAHTFNYAMWGGTMLFAFQKKSGSSASFEKISKQRVIASLQVFRNSLARLSESLLESTNVYGFGAAQMLPSLTYHVPNRLAPMKMIADDNVQRHQLKYPGFHFSIVPPQTVDFEGADVVITALDSARQILSRLIQLNPKRILLPIHVV